MPPELQTSLRKTEIVKAKILKQINDYRLCAGQRIPPEAELTQRLEVSRSTVREAIGALVHEGLLYRRRGSGTYLREIPKPSDKDNRPQTVRVGVVVFSQNMLQPIPYLAEIMRGLIEPQIPNAPLRVDTILLAANSDFAGTGGVHFLDAARENRVDGLLFTVIEHVEPQQLKWLEDNDKTIVFCSAPYPHGNYPCVRSDLTNGICKTVSALYRDGTERVGLLLPRRTGRTAAAFLAGYVMARSTMGLDSAQQCVAYDEGERPRTTAAVDDLVAAGAKAIVCYDDESAVATIRHLKSKRLHVPQDIAVVGANDTIAPGTEGIPALTTVRLPLRDMGRAARDLFLSVADGRSIARRGIVFEPELVIRESALAKLFAQTSSDSSHT